MVALWYQQNIAATAVHILNGNAQMVHVFSTMARGVLCGHWCPTCAKDLTQSYGAEAVLRKEAKALRIKKMREYRLRIKEEVMNSHKRQKRSAAAKASTNNKPNLKWTNGSLIWLPFSSFQIYYNGRSFQKPELEWQLRLPKRENSVNKQNKK